MIKKGRSRLRFLTAGESHGPALTGIIEGLPAGLQLETASINSMLKRRQQGYGRGGRMTIEKDQVKVLSGLRHGKTLGTPLTLVIENRDWENWQDVMGIESGQHLKTIAQPRPGHADLAGGIKYQHRDLRNVLERASARETAIRTAVGAVAAAMLRSFKIEIVCYVVAIGAIHAQKIPGDLTAAALRERINSSVLLCPDAAAEKKMCTHIDEARERGDTLGGVFEVTVSGIPPGLGSHVQWDRRLDSRLTAALMSIPGIKGVEIGLGFAAAGKPGSQVHDPIILGDDGRISRPTNHAGGLEGGISNGEKLVLRAAMKPIPTLLQALPSVDLKEKKNTIAAVERSDVCAVSAASVVGEAVVAWELARVFREKFAGDSMVEVEHSFQSYLHLIKTYLED